MSADMRDQDTPGLAHDRQPTGKRANSMSGAKEIFWVFLGLGVSSFGGAIAHIVAVALEPMEAPHIDIGDVHRRVAVDDPIG